MPRLLQILAFACMRGINEASFRKVNSVTVRFYKALIVAVTLYPTEKAVPVINRCSAELKNSDILTTELSLEVLHVLEAIFKASIDDPAFFETHETYLLHSFLVSTVGAVK